MSLWGVRGVLGWFFGGEFVSGDRLGLLFFGVGGWPCLGEAVCIGGMLFGRVYTGALRGLKFCLS